MKDVFDVAGYKTGAGNPEYLAAHPAATVTAPAVTKLVDAGARLVGKAITDEFTWSLAGTNPHYGTPRNPRDPERFPGGSSSGSAVAVAAGLVPFALGTDTAGSVRVPASYCGVFGMRPTHGRVDNSGVVPLAPSYDTVGWFARDGSLLRDVGTVLLGPGADRAPAHEIVILSDAFLLADDDVRDALLEAVEALATRAKLRLTSPSLLRRRRARLASHGRGVSQVDGARSVGGARRVAHRGETATRPRRRRALRDGRQRPPRKAPARCARCAIAAAARHAELCRHGAILAVPAAPSVAPRLDMPIDELPALRARTLAVGIVPTLVGAPSVSVPVARIGDLPVNLALIGAHGSDETLLALAAELGLTASRQTGDIDGYRDDAADHAAARSAPRYSTGVAKSTRDRGRAWRYPSAPRTPSHDCIVQLSAAAALTRRVALWTTIIILPAHDAVDIAKKMASVDVLCDGRLTVGVGVGGREHDYRAINAPFTRRWQRMDEQVATMRRIWRGEAAVRGRRSGRAAPGTSGRPAAHRRARWARSRSRRAATLGRRRRRCVDTRR